MCYFRIEPTVLSSVRAHSEYQLWQIMSLRKFQLTKKPGRGCARFFFFWFEISSDQMHYINLAGLSAESNINMRITDKRAGARCPTTCEQSKITKNKKKKKKKSEVQNLHGCSQNRETATAHWKHAQPRPACTPSLPPHQSRSPPYHYRVISKLSN